MQHISSKKNTRPNQSNVSEPDFEMYTKAKKVHATVTSTRKDKLDPDNISEESLMPVHNQERKPAGAIRKTVQVYQV